MAYQCCSPAVVITDYAQKNHLGNPYTRYYGHNQWLEKHTLEDALNWDKWHESQEATIIGCNKCIWCRMKNAYSWANRLMLEASYHDHESVWFLTLTYDDNHLHKDKMRVLNGIEYWNVNDQARLEPKDLTDFWKRLRKKLNVEGLKYYACGEYGDPANTCRPHYHAIVYGMKLQDVEQVMGKDGKPTPYYFSETVMEKWEKGWITLRPVTIKSCAYVASYTLKKRYGEKEVIEHYYKTGKFVQEFQRSSKGLAKQFYIDNKEIIYMHDEIVNEQYGVKIQNLRYFDNLFKDEEPEVMETIKMHRRMRAANKMANMKAETTDPLHIILQKKDREQKQSAAEHLTKKMAKKKQKGQKQI